MLTRSNFIHPVLVVYAPVDGAFNAFFELEGGFQAKFRLQFVAVNGLEHIVAEAVCNECDEMVEMFFRIAKQTILCFDYNLDVVDIFPLIKTSDSIRVSHLTFMENEVNDTSIVFYEKPVSHIITLAISRQWLTITNVVDEQWYKHIRK